MSVDIITRQDLKEYIQDIIETGNVRQDESTCRLAWDKKDRAAGVILVFIAYLESAADNYSTVDHLQVNALVNDLNGLTDGPGETAAETSFYRRFDLVLKRSNDGLTIDEEAELEALLHV